MVRGGSVENLQNLFTSFASITNNISSYGLRIAGTLSIIQEVQTQVTHFSMH